MFEKGEDEHIGEWDGRMMEKEKKRRKMEKEKKNEGRRK